MSLRWRHHLIGIRIENAGDDFRGIGLSWFDGDFEFASFGRPFIGVETEVGFAVFFVWAVAMEALIGEDGADIAVEIDFP